MIRRYDAELGDYQPSDLGLSGSQSDLAWLINTFGEFAAAVLIVAGTVWAIWRMAA